MPLYKLLFVLFIKLMYLMGMVILLPLCKQINLVTEIFYHFRRNPRTHDKLRAILEWKRGPQISFLLSLF